MIVTCPSCATKFEVPDDKYRPGRKARCSNCGFIFPLPELGSDGMPLEPPAPAAPPEPSPPAPAAPVPAERSADAPPAPEPAQPAAPLEEPLSDSTEDVVIPPRAPKQKRRFGGRTLPVVLAGLLVVGLLGYGGYMVYGAFFSHRGGVPERLTDGKLTRSLGGGRPGPVSDQEAARQAAVRHLALEGVRQYTITDNETTGPMIVIEGSVINNFDGPRDLILLEITLFDDKGKALVMREQYGGVTLSLLQLRSLNKAALEAALVNQVNILSNNTNTPPGGRVPFTTVFFDLPKGAYEFEVRIVDVQDPAEKK